LTAVELRPLIAMRTRAVQFYLIDEQRSSSQRLAANGSLVDSTSTTRLRRSTMLADGDGRDDGPEIDASRTL
jgi:hypothetical protein